MDRSAPTTDPRGGGGDSEKWMGGNSWDGNVSGASASRDSGFEEDGADGKETGMNHGNTTQHRLLQVAGFPCFKTAKKLLVEV